MQSFPDLNPHAFRGTRDALHSCAAILGDTLKTIRPKRKHWWHASLRPSLSGLTTGVVYADCDFELSMDWQEGLLRGRTATGERIAESIGGQSTAQLAHRAAEFLAAAGIAASSQPDESCYDSDESTAFSVEQARLMAQALRSVTAAMTTFRASIREECSPIQLWPHHFDLSMLWLPGSKVPGQDPANEEYADRQMNFGFTFGDEGIPEPYFYVTAYPLPDALPTIALPAGASWHADGFNGAVLPYRRLVQENDPAACLLRLWNTMLEGGRQHL